MADDAPRPDDDDATRIYRPYGSPPPEESEPAPDPFAPVSGRPPADPFAPPPP